MPTYETPGVYFERADAGAGGLAALRTDIAGFVGLARRGPAHLAVPVESFRQFESWFGGCFDNGYLAYAAQAFFENGGRRLWAVRVTSDAAAVASLDVLDASGAAAWRIEAAGAGVAGNDLQVRLVESRRTQVTAALDEADARRLLLAPVAGFSRNALIEVFSGAASLARAVVREVDAVAGRIMLDRELAGVTPRTRLRVETIAYSLEVYELGRLLAVYDDLALLPEHERYGPAILKQPWVTPERREPEGAPPASTSARAIGHFRAARGRGAEAPPSVIVRELRDATRRGALDLLTTTRTARPLAGGADGLAALTARDYLGEATSPEDSDVRQEAARRGLRALESIDELGVIAIPDIHIQPREPTRFAPPPACAVDGCLPRPETLPAPRIAAAVGDVPPRFELETIYQVQAALVGHCESRRDRIALLDPPFDTVSRATGLTTELRAWRRRFDSPFAALYAPWLDVVDPLATRPGARRDARLTRAIPPSGHMAGVIAATDFRRGVHAAPANVALGWVQGVSLNVDDTQHGILNETGINVVRALPGRGVRPMGARTLSSDTSWRYLSVRRLVSMIAKTIDASIQWAVFEPNDWRTRAKLQLVIGSFLQELWVRGALAGRTGEEAYFVRHAAVDDPFARARGELVIDVGVAPSQPFEFIVLRIGRDSNGFAIAEHDAARVAA